MGHFYKLLSSALLALSVTSYAKGQINLNFESETPSDYAEYPGVDNATRSFSGFDFTAYSSASNGIYDGFERDNPSNYPTSIGYNSVYYYMGTLNGDPLTSLEIKRSTGGLFDFQKIRLSPSPSPSSYPYDTPFDVYVQGYKNNVAVTEKVTKTTTNHGQGGYVDAVDFDLSNNADFKGIDKVVITTSVLTNEYIAMDNVVLSPVDVTPVIVSEFKANLVNKEVYFNWSSGMEANFSHFTLQKSLDGKHYTPVKELTAMGSNSHYQTVLSQSENIAYYRLKLVDLNGDFSFYDQILTVNQKANEHLAFLLYPNPADNYIKFSAKQSGRFVIYNELGRQVLSKQLNAGDNSINIESLAGGIYYAVFDGQRTLFIKK